MRRFAIVLSFLGGVLAAAPALAQPFLAVSLGRAVRVARQQGRKNPQLAFLAGMTRAAGFVVDRDGNDLILVGEEVPGEDALTIEDLVTALRAGAGSALPEVSIDFLTDTLRTKQQRIRFEGGIADTSLGNDLLASDVILKKLGLGLLDSGLPEVRSYLGRRLEEAARDKRDSSASVRTRFNFRPKWLPGPHDDVRVGRDFSVFVEMESTRVSQTTVPEPESEEPTAACRPLQALVPAAGAGWQGAAAEKFRADLTDQFEPLSTRFPELARLAELLRLLQLAREVHAIAPPEALRYWSAEFPLPRQASPKEFPLLDACGSWQSPDGATQTIFLNGGVTLDALQSELVESGNLNAFRDIVLGSRPKDASRFWWRVPLGTWEIPGYRLRSAPARTHVSSSARSFKELPGFSMIERHQVKGPASTTEPPPTLRFPPADTKPPPAYEHLLPQAGSKLAMVGPPNPKQAEPLFDPHGLGSQLLRSAGSLAGHDVVRGPSDPFGTIQRQLGGVELAATGKAIGDLVRVRAATWLPEQRQIVLLGGQTLTGPSMNDQDLAVALLLVFGPTGGDARFSLDPANPADPDGKWIKAVYEPREVIAGTSFGDALFEADYLLKQYALGTAIDEDGLGSSRHSGVPGFKSMFDLAFEKTDKTPGCRNGKAEEAEREPQRARFWIEPDRMELRRDGEGVVFDKASMRIKAKKQVADASHPTGLRDVDAEDPDANRFAALFTALYDQIAVESPAFERVRELAKAVALAKWLKQQGAVVDLEWARERVGQRHPFADQISKLGANAVQTRTERYTENGTEYVCERSHSVRLSGGVRMVVSPVIAPPAKVAAAQGPDPSEKM